MTEHGGDVRAPAVRERPIIFAAESVRAILEGRKTQTRRIVKGCALKWLGPSMFVPEYVANPENSLCPYGVPGDRLWVREAFRQGDGSMSVHYRADPDEVSGGPWRPSIHMPRWASRLTLEIMEVRVQRLQEISEEDARAEGVQALPLQGPYAGRWWTADVSAGLRLHGRSAEQAFNLAWESINWKRAPWASNPWVWAIAFRKAA